MLNIPVKQLLGVGLNVKLIKTLQSEQSLKKLETYKSPILFVFGSRDSTTVGLQQYLNEIDYCARTHVQINIIEGADHLFGIVEHIDQVILQTNNWIYTNY